MKRKIGLVLTGGAAHGAYQVGVISHIAERVAPEVKGARFDILCGTSVGAINACAMAAGADDPMLAVARLRAVWRDLRLNAVLRADARGILALAGAMLSPSLRRPHRAALFDPRPLVAMVEREVRFERISERLRAGDIAALAVPATQVSTGRTVVFIQQRPAVVDLGPHPDVVAEPVRMTATHARASAAVPLLFPAVEIRGELYCDGGLRQMLPLSPALRLGADALVVVNPRSLSEDDSADARRAREVAYGSPVFLIGRTLDVLLVDRVRSDLDRLQHVNAILDAGAHRFGAGFLRELNDELAERGQRPVRPFPTVEIRASEDIAKLAADFIASPRFPRRAGRAHAWLFRWLAELEGAREATALSYLLFDGEFAHGLIELGRRDARAQHDELCELFARGGVASAA